MGSSESVGAGQHPHLVAQQAAVGRIVNVGLDHSGVDAHPPEFGEALHLGALNVKIPGTILSPLRFFSLTRVHARETKKIKMS